MSNFLSSDTDVVGTESFYYILVCEESLIGPFREPVAAEHWAKVNGVAFKWIDTIESPDMYHMIHAKESSNGTH